MGYRAGKKGLAECSILKYPVDTELSQVWQVTVRGMTIEQDKAGIVLYTIR